MPQRLLRDWTDSERVNQLSAQAEVFFVRLIMKADDYGRYYGSPQLLKSYLYPLRDVRLADITRLIAECVKAGLIVEYGTAAKRYIAILNFGQRLRLRGDSKFPPPDVDAGQLPDTCPTHDGHMTDTRPPEARSEKREARSVKHTTSPLPVRLTDTGASDADGEQGAALAQCQVFRGFPKTDTDVLAIADRSGVICTPEQAEAYRLSREATNWILRGGQPVRNVGADLKRFVMAWRQNRADDAKRNGGGNNADFEADKAAARRRFAEEGGQA